MKLVLPRRQLLRAGCASALAMAGVQARACEFFSPTLRLTHPWTRATPDDATTAVLCMRLDEVQQDDRLVGIQTPFATGAEMGGPDASPARLGIDVVIPKGSETVLSEHGTHIRLTGLKQPLELGRTYPMRLLFEVGGMLRADLSVDYGFGRFR